MDIIFECPHCLTYFVMNEKEFNCRIIRHAVLKDSMIQINPHAPKTECDELVAKNLIVGCAKPLKIVNKSEGEYIVVECDYL